MIPVSFNLFRNGTLLIYKMFLRSKYRLAKALLTYRNNARGIQVTHSDTQLVRIDQHRCLYIYQGKFVTLPPMVHLLHHVSVNRYRIGAQNEEFFRNRIQTIELRTSNKLILLQLILIHRKREQKVLLVHRKSKLLL